MKIIGYHSEEELVQLLQEGKISRVQYVEHHDADMKEDYHIFCNENHLDKSKEESAISYLEYIESRLLQEP